MVHLHAILSISFNLYNLLTNIWRSITYLISDYLIFPESSDSSIGHLSVEPWPGHLSTRFLSVRCMRFNIFILPSISTSLASAICFISRLVVPGFALSESRSPISFNENPSVFACWMNVRRVTSSSLYCR